MRCIFRFSVFMPHIYISILIPFICFKLAEVVKSSLEFLFESVLKSGSNLFHIVPFVERTGSYMKLKQNWTSSCVSVFVAIRKYCIVTLLQPLTAFIFVSVFSCNLENAL